MLKEDVATMNDREREALQLSFHPNMTTRKVRTIVLSSGLVALGIALFALFGAGIELLAGISVATIAVSAVEKLTYTRAMTRYESLVRKLVHRLESLEGTPLSPIGEADETVTPLISSPPEHPDAVAPTARAS